MSSLKAPIAFEPMAGRDSGSAAFQVRMRSYTGRLTATGTLELFTGSKAGERNRSQFSMELQNANRTPRVAAESPLPTKINYFVGNDPRSWRRDIPTFAAVLYRGVYPGVDLHYHGTDRKVEYDFRVAPGADPRRIRMQFPGASSVSIDARQRLQIRFGNSTMVQERPVAYQITSAGVRNEIACRFVRAGRRGAGFVLAEYDRSLPVTIDPTIVYSSFVDGTLDDDIYKIAFDGQGNLCFVGRTHSANLGLVNPLQAQPRQMFVGKLNAAGTAFLYLTYLGTGGQDQPYGIAADAAGSCYLLGATATPKFPVTPGAFQTTFQGGADYFVAKLNPSGNALVYATYLGGSGYEAQTEVLSGGIAVDAGGNAYVSGSTQSSDFPVTASAFQRSPRSWDGFVTKINSAGSALIYSTRLGGSGDDFATALAVDSQGQAFVTGYTGSADFPVTPGAFQAHGRQHYAPIGVYDAFVAKVNASGSGLIYASYLGGFNNDAGWSIQADVSGNAYVGGTTSSQDFPVTPGAYQTMLSGSGTGCTYFGAVPCTDFFVAKINDTGTALVYSTLLGGSKDEGGGLPWGSNGGAIAVDAAGAVYVVSSTRSADLRTQAAIQFGPQGGSDAFVCKLSPAGSAVSYCTYLGGLGDDFANGAAADSAGNVYISGSTASPNFPNATGLPLKNLIASAGFILEISDLTLPLSIQTPSVFFGPNVGSAFSQTLQPGGGQPPYSGWFVLQGSLPPGLTLNSSGLLTGVPTAAGTSTFVIEVHDARGAIATKSLTVIVSGFREISVNAVVNAASYQGGAVAPGEIVSIFGSELGEAGLALFHLDERGRVATELAGTQVLFDGVPAPVIAASARQVNVVVPYDVGTKDATDVQVIFQRLMSNTIHVPVAKTVPGTFTLDASGRGAAACINQDGTINSGSNPAVIGSSISLYLTGEGQTTPSGIDGAVAGVPASKPLLPVTVALGGVPAEIKYAGGAPGEVAGVIQVNVVVPAGVATGMVSVVVSVGGVNTQPGVTLAVKAR